jgi:hypothetical protein
MALQRFKARLSKHLRDQAHVLVHEDVATVADRNSGGFLAAMLKCIQTEVREFGDLVAGSPDPKYATGILGAFVSG